VLLGYHFLCGVYLRRFRDDRNTHSHVFFRWFNEAPVVLLIAIVAMVVVRPF
ncbi:MAG: CopD family protein, partial [Candidatus Puniceispirillum sp.]